jgi:hypothetical protein
MKYPNLGTMNALIIRQSMASILRVYIMKYSNFGTMNASSIRWSMAASKLEHGRPCGDLLDALACSNLAPS